MNKEYSNVNCPLSDFYSWAKQRGYKIPLPKDQFNYVLGKYAVQKMKLKSGDFGFVKGELKFYRM